MQNEQGTKQPMVSKDDALQTPQPPKNVFVEMPEAQASVAENTDGRDDNATENALPKKAEKVQDFDWNNGRPDVTTEHVEVLAGHKTPEMENAASLRENKGEKPGEHPFEASEEVNTGQSGG